ncbi:hypothetical protein EBS02_10370, partial [bacterium]|nr:hypothetical protein [bacterium]
VENEEVVFSEEDLSFLDRMEKDKSTFQFLDLIKEEMYLIIKNPLIGTRYVGSNYGLAFRKELPENAGNALILKRKVRRKYRLIYAYGGNLSRPYFIEFDHRKDVYKHRQVGTSS